MDNQEKGRLYEHFVKGSIINELHKNAYLWNQCPENLLIKHGLIKSRNEARLLRREVREGDLHNHKDIGIDIIQVDKEEKNLTIVQCKNGYSKGLKLDDVAGIMLRRASKDVTTSIYYTSKLSANVKNVCGLSDRVVMFDYKKHKDAIYKIENDNKIYFIKLLYDETKVEEQVKTVFEPYPYQLEAIECSNNHFIENNRGILTMPCGTGKTLVCYLIAKKYKHIIILSPLREFAKQNMDRFTEYGYDYKNTLLVDSDGERDIDTVKEFINTNKNILISSTYKSMDVLYDCLELFDKDDALFIIDEFHNLSKANITDENNPIYKLLITDHKILCVSATPRIYELEQEEAVSDDAEMLTGNIVYQMTFKDAIANKHITDYKIWVPFVKEDTTELDKELSIYDIETDVKNKCKFLFSALANNGSRKCIVYCKDTNDMKAQMDAMKTMNDFYALKIDITSISCEDNEKKRKTVLQNFANNDNIQLLYSIKILNECIDIPSCDSIYISYAAKNKITTIQRICRALRIDKNNFFKVANIYLWCSEYDEILETLSSIKEYDCEIIEKIKLNVVDMYEKDKEKVEKEVRQFEEDVKELKDYIVGIREFRCITWEEKLEMVKKYIAENGKLPSSKSKDKLTATIGIWIVSQKKNYKLNQYNMKNKFLRVKFQNFINQYSEFFKSNEASWNDKLAELVAYIKEHKILPVVICKDTGTRSKLGQWLSDQKKNYTVRNAIMKDDKIFSKWTYLIKKYPELFMTKEQLWNQKFTELKNYVKINNKLPSSKNPDKHTRSLGQWLTDQKKSNKNNMRTDDDLKFQSFIKENCILFLSRHEIWESKLKNLQEYVKLNNEIPLKSSKDKNTRLLGEWFVNQQNTYNSLSCIMKEDAFRLKFEKFINENSNLIKSRTEEWNKKFKNVCQYIKLNKKLPLTTSKNEHESTMARWIRSQKKIYKANKEIMKIKTIKLTWENFVKENYNLVKSYDEKWNDNLEKVKNYIKIYKKFPSVINEDKHVCTLGRWVVTQRQNYKYNKNIMKKPDIIDIWEQFLEDCIKLLNKGCEL